MKNRNRLLIGLCCLLPLVAMTETLHAQMNYQGRLTDAQGNAITDGQYNIEFRLFNASTLGVELWGPFTAANVDVVAGRFNTIIGATDTASRALTTALANPDIYLQIKFGGNAPLTPRQQILAAPKALHAAKATNADNAANATTAAFATNAGTSANATNATHATTADTAANFTSVVLKTDEVNARVGIGTPTPISRLHVAGATTVPSAVIEAVVSSPASLDLRATNFLNGPGSWRFATTPVFTTLIPSLSHSGGHLAIAPVDQSGAAGTTALTVQRNGRVGIGTSTPLAPLHVFGAAATTFNWQAVVDGNSAADKNENATRSHAIIAESAIRASIYDVVSDSRIKNIISQSDTTTDLATLMGIEITDYTYRDVRGNGSALQKKVIAQQVEKVYPVAVSQSTNVIPDIYRKAKFESGWVVLATDLKPGERVRLISENGSAINEVVEVGDGKFRTDFTADDGEIFVYGREVNDFRTVDYDAIAMLNVSATQQIKKEKDAEVAALKEEIAELRERVSALDSMVQARDLKFTHLEKRLDALAPPVSRTVSMKSGDSAR